MQSQHHLRWFAGGVMALAIAFLLAALAGFEPRRIPVRAVSSLLGIGLVTLIVGAIRFWRATRDHPGARARLAKLLGLSVLVVCLVGGSIFGVYAHWHRRASRYCETARFAATTAARLAALEAAEPYRERVRAFDEIVVLCEEADRDMRELEAGRCPAYPAADMRCACGQQIFPEDWPSAAVEAECSDYLDDGNTFVEGGVLSYRERYDRPRH